MIHFLELEDLLAAARSAVGPDVQVGDWGLLESAVARPRATVFGEDAYCSLDEKAAALLSSIVRNHALVDGNKRLGWVGVRLFYDLNNVQLRAPQDEAYALVMGIAGGSVTDVGPIAGGLAGWHGQASAPH